MKQQAIPVTTSVGKIYGRDAIHLDSMSMQNNSNFQLQGAFCKGLCENLTGEGFQDYTIVFYNVSWMQMIELEYCDWRKSVSSFDELLHTAQLHTILDKQRHLHGKLNKAVKHYIFSTYDLVFEIICQRFELTLT